MWEKGVKFSGSFWYWGDESISRKKDRIKQTFWNKSRVPIFTTLTHYSTRSFSKHKYGTEGNKDNQTWERKKSY